MPSLNNNRGQALLESLWCLPVVIGFFTLILIGIETHFSDYLIDHWVYEACLCLAKEQPTQTCSNKLLSQLQHIPFIDFQLNQFSRDEKRILVKLIVDHHLLTPKAFTEELFLPLQSSDFRSAQ